MVRSIAVRCVVFGIISEGYARASVPRAAGIAGQPQGVRRGGGRRCRDPRPDAAIADAPERLGDALGVQARVGLRDAV